MKKLAFIAFIFSFIVYFLTSAGKTPYDYFTRLSDSFLQGKIYLTDNPPWLSELITISDGKYTFVNPPMPAFLATPLVLLSVGKFEQQYLAHIIGASLVVLTMYLSFRIKGDKKLAIWAGILVGFSSIVWHLSSVGSVWYLGQITASVFILLAILESLSKKRPWVLGILMSGALLSRLQVLPMLIFFVYLIKDKLDKRGVLQLFLGLSIFAVVYGLYNFARFGNPFETGYTLIPGILDEPWFHKGQFSLYYIQNHLNIFLLGLPKLTDEVPYIYPSWAGMAIWITTPAFIFSVLAPIKERLTRVAWISTFAIALINFSYGSTGFAQFGYRYAVDFYPLLLFLTIKGVANKNGPKWYHWLLLGVGIFVNLWGVLWINKFGWGSY